MKNNWVFIEMVDGAVIDAYSNDEACRVVVFVYDPAFNGIGNPQAVEIDVLPRVEAPPEMNEYAKEHRYGT